MKLEKQSLMIGYIHGGNVTEAFHQSVVRFLRQDAKERDLFYKMSAAAGAYLDVNRNLVAENCRKSPAEALLFIDTDINFNPEQVYRLVDDLDPVERPVVSGLYFGYMGATRAPLPIWFDDEVIEGSMPIVRRIRPGLQRIGACGMGFCLIHKRVLNQLGDGCFDRRNLITGAQRINYGEDMAFSLRCREAGIPIFGDGSIVVGHMKTHEENFDSFTRYWANTPEANAASLAAHEETDGRDNVHS